MMFQKSHVYHPMSPLRIALEERSHGSKSQWKLSCLPAHFCVDNLQLTPLRIWDAPIMTTLYGNHWPELR